MQGPWQRCQLAGSQLLPGGRLPSLLPGLLTPHWPWPAGEVVIDQREVVPGDCVRLYAGELVPGDVRIVSAKDLFLGWVHAAATAAPVLPALAVPPMLPPVLPPTVLPPVLLPPVLLPPVLLPPVLLPLVLSRLSPACGRLGLCCMHALAAGSFPADSTDCLCCDWSLQGGGSDRGVDAC